MDQLQSAKDNHSDSLEDYITRRLEAMYFSANTVINLDTNEREEPVELEKALKVHLPKVMQEIQQYTTTKINEVLAEVEEAIDSVEVDREATEKHIREVLADEEEAERQILNMQIEADDRHDTLNDVRQKLAHIKERNV